jgi:hypothetical protein
MLRLPSLDFAVPLRGAVGPPGIIKSITKRYGTSSRILYMPCALLPTFALLALLAFHRLSSALLPPTKQKCFSVIRYRYNLYLIAIYLFGDWASDCSHCPPTLSPESFESESRSLSLSPLSSESDLRGSDLRTRSHYYMLGCDRTSHHACVTRRGVVSSCFSSVCLFRESRSLTTQ